MINMEVGDFLDLGGIRRMALEHLEGQFGSRLPDNVPVRLDLSKAVKGDDQKDERE